MARRLSTAPRIDWPTSRDCGRAKSACTSAGALPAGSGRRHCRCGAIPHTVQRRPRPPRGAVSEECPCSIRSSRSSSAPGSARCCAGA
ncbi:TPA: hypothetical protein QDE50_15170 [Burkholderia cenocepacia]|nr:hypothetical protein [Burkholderia cenocepacia]HDR9888650.1 hypothetical protein [Burkholderia cenocepacia]